MLARSSQGDARLSLPFLVIKYCLSAGKNSLAREESPFSLHQSAQLHGSQSYRYLNTHHCQTGNLKAKKSPAATNSSTSRKLCSDLVKLAVMTYLV